MRVTGKIVSLSRAKSTVQSFRAAMKGQDSIYHSPHHDSTEKLKLVFGINKITLVTDAFMGGRVKFLDGGTVLKLPHLRQEV
jgi:hypothetical protein